MNVNSWKPEYLLDIDVIDEQHKRFFKIVSQIGGLRDKAHAGDTVTAGEVLRVLFSLRTYAFKHFHTEETLFVKYAYPKMFEHMDLHDHYLRKNMQFMDEIKHHRTHADSPIDKELVAKAEEITEYTLEWWSTHILKVDSQYVQYVKPRKK